MSNLFGEEEHEAKPLNVPVIETSYDVVDHTEDGIPPPYKNDQIIGHQEIQNHFLRQWQSGKFPHAVALCGQKGIGKATLAFHLARFVLDQSAPETQDKSLFGTSDEDMPFDTISIATDTPTYHKVVSGGHPDLKALGDFFNGEETEPNYTASVDDIRQIPAFLRMTASNGGWRVVIVDNADGMNRNAQNAILKNLEEPPKNTLLILVVHRPGALLPTIRSRVQMVPCNDLHNDDIKALLRMDNPAIDMEELEFLIFMAENSIGKALLIAREGTQDDILEAVKFIACVADLTNRQIDEFCDTLLIKSNAPKAERFKTILIWLVQRMIHCKARNIGIFKGIELENDMMVALPLRDLMDKNSVQAWLDVLEQLEEHFELCERTHLDNYHMVFESIHIMRRGIKSNK